MLGDRWTLPIIREMLFGVSGFNELTRGLPGISRSVLVERLRHLERLELIERSVDGKGRTTGYALTAAGQSLKPVVFTLGDWAAEWCFGEPNPSELDSDLVLMFISRHVNEDELPGERAVVRFNLTRGRRPRYWLVMRPGDISICLRDPGFDTDVTVDTDTETLYRVYFGWTPLGAALKSGKLELHGAPPMRRAFPKWFKWSRFQPAVRRQVSRVA